MQSKKGVIDITKEKKKKDSFRLYADSSVLDLARQWYKQDNCNSLSEYICKAIAFYSGYVANEKNPEYLPKVVISTLKSIVRESEFRQSRQSYRVAVELSLLLNIMAASNKFPPDEVRAMRETCEDEVKQINGTMRLDEAIRWQDS